MTKRLHLRHKATFAERLASEAKRLKELARMTPHGHDRDVMLRKVGQVEMASHINEWALSSRLQPPK